MYTMYYVITSLGTGNVKCPVSPHVLSTGLNKPLSVSFSSHFEIMSLCDLDKATILETMTDTWICRTGIVKVKI